jgi:16S rRNA (cytosine1402-N4)-methyltransferase
VTAAALDTPDAHVTVLLSEAVDALAVKPDGVYVDATFGRGGHSRAILSLLGEQGRLIAMDRDPGAVAAGAAIMDGRLMLVHAPFSELAEVLAEQRLAVVDGILFDLGVSSPQLDEAERGFSFRFDAPLDMRMDTTRGETAGEWLARASVREITEVLRNYGEERFAYEIAKAIVAGRDGEDPQPVATTRQLATLVAATVRTREPGQHPATRTFQALRIHVNQELEELSLALPQAIRALKAGGRLAVISFHSLEDRIVKRFLRAEEHPDNLPSRLPLRASELPQARVRVLGKPLRPGKAEVAANPRARSAVLRVAEKLGA